MSASSSPAARASSARTSSTSCVARGPRARRSSTCGPRRATRPASVDTVPRRPHRPRGARARRCAAATPSSTSPPSPTSNDVGSATRRTPSSVNARGTLDVLEAARRAGVKRVVYASTIWVYSDVRRRARSTRTRRSRRPSHLYTATKLAGELYCKSYAELYGLDYTILRFGIPYGPRARAAAVVPAFVNKALAGEPLTHRRRRRAVAPLRLRRGPRRRRASRGLDAARRQPRLQPRRRRGRHDQADRRAPSRTIVGDVEIVYTPGRAGDFGGAEVVRRARRATSSAGRAHDAVRRGRARATSTGRRGRRGRAAPRAPRPPARLAVPRPSRETVVRDARWRSSAALAGATIGLAARFHALDDRADARRAPGLLAVAVVLLGRVDWARRAQRRGDRASARWSAFAGVRSFARRRGAPILVRAVRDNVSLVLFALGGLAARQRRGDAARARADASA